MSNQDDKLQQLSQLHTPAPSDAARRRAMEAAMLAFDAEQQEAQRAAKGQPSRPRLRSILANWTRNWTMDNRLTYGFGTAAVALLMLPLGYQLYNSTALTPAVAPQRNVVTEVQPAPAPAEPVEQAAVSRDSAVDDEDATERMAAVTSEAEAGAPNMVAAQPAAEAPAVMAAPELMEAMPMADMAQPAAAASATRSTQQMSQLAAVSPMQRTLPEASGDVFTGFAESPVKITRDEPVSTFSIDVDTASYAYVRRALNQGFVPPADAVRVEEMINYFDYDYALPEDPGQPFQPNVIVYPSPWDSRTQLVQIGIKGYAPPSAADVASNLVFLVDSSGSMNDADKLPLLKRALGLLVDNMSENDTISIVAYAGSAGVVLPPTRGDQKGDIIAALDGLAAGGSTAGAEGIELAYQLAEQNRVADGVNRVILATDGDFNVGIEDPEALKDFIRDKRDGGVFLSVLGFGSGNLGDDTMQALAQNGNGNASYIDSFKEAHKVLVEDAGGTLTTIASDVKIQVEFNPAYVAEYRLIGYETRGLNREDFNNDRVDAGEIGAGATVTALYEIVPVGSGAELNAPLRYGEAAVEPTVVSSEEIGFLKMRYKLPGEDTSTLVETPIGKQLAVAELAAASDDARFAAAVAAFGQKLKGSRYAQMSWDDIRVLAQGARGADENGHRAEFLQLIDLAKALATPRPAGTAPAVSGRPAVECVTPPGGTACTTR